MKTGQALASGDDRAAVEMRPGLDDHETKLMEAVKKGTVVVR